MTQTQNTEQNQSLKHYFKLGQKDYAQGFHEPFGGIASYLGIRTDREDLINEAYRRGWDKAQSQDSQSSLTSSSITIFM